MQVPSTLRALWAQRKRWARGQGEVLHAHLGEVLRWRNHRMWLLAFESLAVAAVGPRASRLSLVIAVFGVAIVGDEPFGFAFAWGIAIAIVATIQLLVAIWLEHSYDPTILRAFLVAAVYPVAYWLIAALAAVRSQIVALVRGPRGQRVVWDIPREQIGAG